MDPVMLQATTNQGRWRALWSSRSCHLSATWVQRNRVAKGELISNAVPGHQAETLARSEPIKPASFLPQTQDSQTQHQPNVPFLQAPRPPHNAGTSIELRRRREEQLAAAQDLTRQLTSCSTVYEAIALYDAHGDRFNAIHFSALFTTLSRIACGPLDPSSSSSVSAPTPSSSLSSPAHRPLTLGERYTLRHFLADRLVPHVGLRLLGFAPRQLSTVLAALAQLDCPPPAFWLAEWLQHFGRRLGPPTASLAPPAELQQHQQHQHQQQSGGTWGLADARYSRRTPSAAGAQARGSGGGGGAEASGPQLAGPTEVAQAMWALARLRLRPARPPETPPGGAPVDGGAGEGGETNRGQLARTTSTASAIGLAAVGRHGAGAAGEAGATGVHFEHSPGSAGSHDIAGGPSIIWLRAAAVAFARQAPAASAANIARYLWAAARLGYRPPHRVMEILMARSEQLLGSGAATDIGGRELSGLLWALVMLGFRPGNRWLQLASTHAARLARGPAGVGRRKRRGGVRERLKDEARRRWHEAAGAAAATGAAAAPVAGEEPHAAQAAVNASAGGFLLRGQPGDLRRGRAATESAVTACGAPFSAEAVAGGVAHASPTASAPDGPGDDWWGDFMADSDVALASAPSTAQSQQPPSTAELQTQAGTTPVTTSAAPAPMNARHAATCLWALARLGHRPRPDAISSLVARVCPAVPHEPRHWVLGAPAPLSAGTQHGPRDGDHCGAGTRPGTGFDACIATSISTTATTSSTAPSAAGTCASRTSNSADNSPPSTLAVASGAHLARLLHPASSSSSCSSLSSQDLSMACHALGALRVRPHPAQLLGLLACMALRLRAASRHDLVVWLTAVARLSQPGYGTAVRLAVPDPWFALYLRRASLDLEAMPPLALLAWTEAIGRVYTAGARGYGMRRVGGLEPRMAGAAGPNQLGPGSGGSGGARGASGLLKQHANAGQGLKGASGSGLGRPPVTTVLAGAQAEQSVFSVPWVVAVLPPTGQRRTSGCTRSGAGTRCDSSSTGEAAGSSSSSSSSADGAGDGIVVRPAAALLHPDLVRRLFRLAVDRLPALGLEEQCRMAWATARLRPAGGAGWVDTFVRHTTVTLQRHLAHRLELARGAPLDLSRGPGCVESALPAPSTCRGGATGGDTGAAASGGGDGDFSGGMAEWLVKLVWAVALLLGRSPTLHALRLRPYHRRHQQRPLPCRVARAVRKAAAAGRRPPARPPPSSPPPAQVSRLWCALLLDALLPQLPSLTDAQLLRLVYSLAHLRRAPTRGPTRGPGLDQAARLGAYCRRRVEATCGGEDACDLTTAGLLRWTHGWEAGAEGGGEGGSGGEGVEERAAKGARRGGVRGGGLRSRRAAARRPNRTAT